MSIRLTKNLTPSELLAIFDGTHTTGNPAFVVVSRRVINFDLLKGAVVLRWNQSGVPAGNAEVRLYNESDATVLGSLVVSSTGLKSFAVSDPDGVKLVSLQHRRVAGAGASDIEGATLESA